MLMDIYILWHSLFIHYKVYFDVIIKLEGGKYKLTDSVFRDWVVKKFEFFHR